MDEVPVASESDIPIPIEFPAWNDVATKKTPIPIKPDIHLPYCLRIVVNTESSVAIPIRDPMDVKIIIKKIAITTTQSKL
ncbi:hypothetical protein D3C79_1052180 [compost metagenome]